MTLIYKNFGGSRGKMDPETKMFEDHYSNSLFDHLQSSYVYLKLSCLFISLHIYCVTFSKKIQIHEIQFIHFQTAST